jgi:hypothetical protein
MCRADVTPAAESAVVALLDDLARAVATQAGVTRDEVVIGPVDLGAVAVDGVY